MPQAGAKGKAGARPSVKKYNDTLALTFAITAARDIAGRREGQEWCAAGRQEVWRQKFPRAVWQGRLSGTGAGPNYIDSKNSSWKVFYQQRQVLSNLLLKSMAEAWWCSEG